MRVGLVSCAKQKGPVAAPARELYVSQLFRAASAYCERQYDRWLILSAKYGVVGPEDVIDPYDVTLLTMDRDRRRQWGYGVRNTLSVLALANAELFVHAGKVYRDAMALDDFRFNVTVPLEGLGIGQQLAWYVERRQPQPVLI